MSDLLAANSNQPDNPPLIPDLAELNSRLYTLHGEANRLCSEYIRSEKELRIAQDFLGIAPAVSQKLEELGKTLFGEIIDEIENTLTRALREILGQDRRIVSSRDIKNNKLAIKFEVENQGNVENILHGQGGSVCNILSVGLRLIALSQVDESAHRKFLVLDEQDCWLKPSLVPALMRIIAQIAEKLKIQVLIISHHSQDLVSEHVHRIINIAPTLDKGVEVSVEDLTQNND